MTRDIDFVVETGRDDIPTIVGSFRTIASLEAESVSRAVGAAGMF